MDNNNNNISLLLQDIDNAIDLLQEERKALLKYNNSMDKHLSLKWLKVSVSNIHTKEVRDRVREALTKLF